MNRRSFIGSILALGAAPAIVRADSLMRVIARDAPIVFNGTSDYLRAAPGTAMWFRMTREFNKVDGSQRVRFYKSTDGELWIPDYRERVRDALDEAMK